MKNPWHDRHVDLSGYAGKTIAAFYVLDDVCSAGGKFDLYFDDLRKLVLDLAKRGVHVRFVKENLTFTGEDSPMAHLLLSVIGAVAQFERDLIRERQREGIALAKQWNVYVGRIRSLSAAQADDLRRRIKAGERKTLLAREFGITRTTVYEYMRREPSGTGVAQYPKKAK